MSNPCRLLCCCTSLVILLATGLPVRADQGKAAAGDAAPAAGQPAAEKVENAAAPGLPALGRALFSGEKRFSKGGAPCAACHAISYPGVRGGNLAADLTPLYEGMGEDGMKELLKGLDFPTMKRVYADKPLTDEEIAALTAFARDASGRKDTPSRQVFPAAGAGLFACLLFGLTIYKRRIG